ncbi:alpha-L-fucosidase [Chitinophaga sancti]|uniref:alpha-L-fucosidase n=1 Tax=Chitinophaga sancti TaxID=1004 RepID=UPI002A74BC19|nr:alpha-L-fucosidase [Chitinophaga sancti]WPQ61382.1 alpha-L-fucosidase [Chitinophaga sancti]
MKKTIVACSVLFAAMLSVKQATAQETDGLHHMSKEYVAPTDPLVIRKLDKWQDQRFGLFMHWGPYTLWEEVESWSICPDDWVVRKGPYSADYNVYREAYEKLPNEFNPVDFNPQKWADAAKNAGMRYVVFTTKHHDGFCMFDTKQTDYKITAPNVPFSKNPKANIAKEIFDTFRKDSFMIGAYFSKPDWHSQDFWWKYYPVMGRNTNYNIKMYPEKWAAFKEYTYRQIEELMTNYGKIDILWLDGGWVRPGGKQEIDMPKIAAMGRKNQPGLIVVDREVPGEFENYATPEQTLPEKPLPYPWETCMSMGDSWTYTHTDQMKSSLKLVTLLVKIVSRGGNFLLNIGPSAKGDWTPQAYERLADIGAWMKINGEGIHASRPVAPYSDNNVYYTQAKDSSATYAFYTSDSDVVKLPETVAFTIETPAKIKRVSLLGTKAKLSWKLNNGKLEIKIPKNLQQQSGLKYAAAFKVEA